MRQAPARPSAGAWTAACGTLFLLALLTPVSVRAETVLPVFSAEQAARGQAAYVHSCVICHGEDLDDGDFGGAPLRGSWFRNHWGSSDLSELYGYTKSAMPPDNPGSLTDEDYADIVSFILQKNGYASGRKDLGTDMDAMQGMSLQR